jgi:serine/threonine-protein kinase HipA
MTSALLDVYVKERLVGALGPTAGGAYVFNYLAGTPPEDLVSLTMPVRLESYTWSRGLPPFFLMNLPEGFQKDLVRAKLGPHAEVTDPGLLALTGNRTIGRVRVLPQGQPLTHATDDLSLSTLLATSGSREHLLRYLEAGITDGVSGVMPKTLAEKTTAALGEYIVKTGPTNYPGLSVNEYLCLEVARRTGLTVPAAELSRDGQVLVVRRFDRPKSGEWLAVEDFCALKGLDPVSKYSGSLEDLAKLLLIYVRGERQGENAVKLYTLLLLNYAVRNADAHLKNFAVTYTGTQDVALAPVYDIVTVTAYPEHVDDIPGLAIAGRKIWPAGKLLRQYGAGRLSLTAAQMNHCIEAVQTAITETAPHVRELADAYPEFREVGKRMLSEWERGALDITPTVTAKSRAGETLKQSVGLSDAVKPPKVKKKIVYRNPDAPFSRKSR